ncbi:MAG: hypothetical protein KY394_06975 [Actinobacteria bacterium]|nr:hypothetical protein [Actinomycetota bacterium]
MSRTGRAAILLLGLLAAACAGGNGATLESDDVGIVGFHDFASGPEKSFGIFVCASGGDVELQSVEPIEAEGEIEMLGAIMHESSAGFVGADNGFPPEVLEGTEIVAVEGAVVTTPCDEAAPETRTQVVVGVSRSGPSGGTIEGVRINHENGSLDVAGYVIILCGEEMERCEDFAPEG